MGEVRLVGISKRFEDAGPRNVRRSRIRDAGRAALETLDLTIPEGELAVLVGPSGCGKSTTLRIVAGLEEPSSGRVFIAERDVTDLPPAERDVAMVFQSYALYPHLSVADNLAFALRIRKTPESEVAARVAEVARSLGIDEYLERRPKQLSGGQRQRVAIGRALIRNPKLFLFDEPLSNLDAKLRSEMRREIARIHQRSRTTALYVTHDQIEAMTLADRIIVLRDGKVQQVGTPSEIYDCPANRFVAGFFGTPAMNFLPAEAAGLDSHGVIVGIRPEAVTLNERSNATALRAAVDLREVLGAEVLLHLRSEAGELTDRTDAEGAAREGDNVTVWLDRARLHRFDATTENRL